VKVKKTAEVTKFKIRCSRVRLCEHDYGEERERCSCGWIHQYPSCHMQGVLEHMFECHAVTDKTICICLHIMT
jgi:hypothetical protein